MISCFLPQPPPTFLDDNPAAYFLEKIEIIGKNTPMPPIAHITFSFLKDDLYDLAILQILSLEYVQKEKNSPNLTYFKDMAPAMS